MTDKAVFLSASVPIKGRMGYDTADPFLIREAVSAFVEVVLGRRLIVWGGHPAITPMIWTAAEAFGLDYARAVKLYQSEFFKDRYPEDNDKFKNVTFVPAVPGGERENLLAMRRQMFSDYEYSAAVFIGGMEGVHMEYEMLLGLDPRPKIIALPSPGGVAREIFEREGGGPPGIAVSFAFSRWFCRLLEIGPQEAR